MAKYERVFQGDFDEVLKIVDKTILQSMSATLEDGSDVNFGDFRVAVRVYERYSWIGQNRVSLNLTLVGEGDRLFASVITSGGSQAMFHKINTMGEESFLTALVEVLDSYGT